MRSVPGTITDPAMDRLILSRDPTDVHLLDDYQEKAASTAIYPRVYTEDQVKDIVFAMLDIYDVPADGVTELQIEQILNDFETPFNRLVYPILGLAGECGELCNKLKKVARDDQGRMDLDKSEEIADELGDVGWYFAAIATELKTTLGRVASANIKKLFSRKARGVLGGSGDKR